MINIFKKKTKTEEQLKRFLRGNCVYARISSDGTKALLDSLEKERETLINNINPPGCRVFALFGIIDLHKKENIDILSECLKSDIEINLNGFIFNKKI